jgi:predicted transcriptional regulator
MMTKKIKNELQILIEELEKEHDYLENELNACIKEWDFEGAETFKTSLIYTKEKLRILKNLDNPNYDQILRLKRTIEIFKTYEAEDALSQSAILRRQERISAYEKEISNLESKESRFHCDNDALIICLEKIINKEIKGFELEIDNGGVIFEVFKMDSNLKIEIRRTDNHSLGYTTTNVGLAELKKMGFLATPENAVKQIEEFEATKILPTIELLSRVAYEVFSLYGDKKGKIKLKK